MDLASALKPLRILSQIMGVNVHFGRLGRFYTAMMFLVMTSFIYASYSHLRRARDHALSQIDILILWTQLAANIIFISVVLGVCFLKPRQFHFPIEEMRKIDTAFRYFGVKTNDTYLYRKQLVQISLSLIISMLLTCRDVYRAIQQRSFIIFFHWLHYGYVVLLSIITDFLFADYLAVINKRFSKLNQLLKEIAQQNKLPKFNFSILYFSEMEALRKQNTSTFSNVEKIRMLHHDLCSISKKNSFGPSSRISLSIQAVCFRFDQINESFGLQQLFSTTISLIMIIGQLYEAYHFILVHLNPAEIGVQKIMWIVFHVSRLFHISYACSSISYEANFTSSIIHAMPVQQISSTINAQLQHFSVQLIHQNLNFNACGFFNIDFTLLCSILGVVSTYLVILIQMDRAVHCT